MERVVDPMLKALNKYRVTDSDTRAGVLHTHIQLMSPTIRGSHGTPQILARGEVAQQPLA